MNTKRVLIGLNLNELSDIKSALERQENYWFIESHRATLNGNTAQAEQTSFYFYIKENENTNR